MFPTHYWNNMEGHIPIVDFDGGSLNTNFQSQAPSPFIVKILHIFNFILDVSCNLILSWIYCNQKMFFISHHKRPHYYHNHLLWKE
jgi:hypothetical protein